MSSKSEATRSELLVTAYIRDIETRHNMKVPSELYLLMLMFYPKQYKLYGIGKARFHQFGLKQECEEANTMYDEQCTQKRWYYLSKMSSLIHDPNYISCANGNFFILNSQNELYAIGNNSLGGLGVNSKDQSISRFTKIKIAGEYCDNVMEDHLLDVMSHGEFTNHTLIALKTQQKGQKQIFYGFGDNSSHQQGYPSKLNYVAVKIEVLNRLFKHMTIVQISTGYKHTLFLTSQGRVYTCGENEFGNCGIKIDDTNLYCKPQIVPFLYDIMDITCGDHHNLCIGMMDQRNKLWVFGRNDSFQLGLGPSYSDQFEVETAIQNPYFSGDSDDTSVVFTDCGDNFSLAITRNGKAFMFGDNSNGQCGNGAEECEEVSVPFCIQSLEVCKDVLFESGSCGCDHTQLISCHPENNLYGFGSNGYYQTGNFNDEMDQSTPYLCAKTDIGIETHSKIIKVLCDENVTVIICDA